MDVHLRDLRYFVAVAQQLHFTRAAETLYVSQPALSKQIRALERQLRVTLFERDHGKVRLTRAGTELLPHAERMVASWESAMGTRCASRPRSTTPKRPTRRSRAASASACSRRATLPSSRAAP